LKANQPSDLKRKVKDFLLSRKKEILILLFTFLVIVIPFYNSLTKNYVDNSLKQAGITYIITRSINATVSIIKHSQINFNAGIGGSIALGETLDPIDDATERFSNLLTLGLWALGAEKIIYELTNFGLFTGIVITIAVLLLIFPHKFLYKTLIILLFIKIFLPFSAIVSYYTDKYYFSPQIEKYNNELKPKQSLNIQIKTKKESSFLDKIKKSFSNTAEYISEIKEVTKYYVTNSSNIINSLLNLGFLYLAKFLLNILILPLLLFYLLRNLAED